MTTAPYRRESICVFCGSSNDAPPEWLAAAAELGATLAQGDLRLVYGGGGVGLMGACARAARDAGGAVLGVIPQFLIGYERPLADVETLIVGSMHQRKMRMFEESDGFVVLPGAIGTLEEAIELISWRRLGLHAKPIVFYNPSGFWDPLFALFGQFLTSRMVPAVFESSWSSVDTVAAILPAIRAMSLGDVAAAPGLGAVT